MVAAAETVAQRIEAETAKPLLRGAETLACGTRDEGRFGGNEGGESGRAPRGGTSGTMADIEAVDSGPLRR